MTSKKKSIWRKLIFAYKASGGGGGAWNTFTGSIVRFTSKKSSPIRSIIASIAPVQDLHGYENPWPAGGGKNLYNKDGHGTGYIATEYIMSDGHIVQPSSGNWQTSEYIPITGGLYYTVSGLSTSDSTSPAMVYYDANKTYISGVQYSNRAQITDQSPANAAFVRLSIGPTATTQDGVQYEQSASKTSYAPYSNICPISGWTAANVYDESEYDETATPKLTIPFTVGGDTKTIYGGTVSVDADGKVKLTASKGYIYMDGSVSVYNITQSSSGLFGVIINNNVGAGSTRVMSNRFKSSSIVAIGNTYVASNGKPLVAILPDQTITTKEAATAWFSDNPTQFVYDLAEPVEYDLADVTVLSTLVGTNVMWADTGDITVTARGTEIPEPDLNAQQSLNLLLGGRYVNNHTEDEPSDEEALNIILGGNTR